MALTHAGEYATAVRPARKPDGRQQWAKDPSQAGAQNGTRLDATFVNDLVALLLRLFEAYSITATEGDDDLIVDAIEAAIAAGLDTLEVADIDGLAAALALKAPLASPGLTGTPTVPTAAPGTSNTQAASTAFVMAAINSLLDSAPDLLNTLNELAAALGDDPNFATTVTNALALKAPLNSPGLTGTPTAPTAAPTTNTTQIATTAFVVAEIAAAVTALISDATSAGNTLGKLEDLIEALDTAKAPKASPTFTGTPAAPTASPGTSTTQLATTEFVGVAVAGASASAPLPPGFCSIRYNVDAGDTANDIEFHPGKTRNSTDAYNLIATAIRTKQLNATWAAGDDQGGLQSGLSAQNNTWYYLHSIGKSTDAAAFDYFISDSRTSPTLPGSGWDIFQCIGALKTNGSAQWHQFRQLAHDRNEISFVSAIADVSAQSQGNSRTARTLSAPPNSEAIVGFTANNGSVAAHNHLQPTWCTDQIPVGGQGYVSLWVATASVDWNTAGRVPVDASSQLYSDSNQNGNTITIRTHGYRFFAPIIP